MTSARPCARFWGCKVKSRQSCFPGTGSLVKKYKPTTSKHHKNRHEQGSSECWGTQPIQIGKAGRLPGSLMESHGSWVLKYEWESMRRGKRRTDCSLINSRQWHSSDCQSILDRQNPTPIPNFPSLAWECPWGQAEGHLLDKGHSSPILQHDKLYCDQFNELSRDSESWAKQDHGKSIFFFTHKEDWEKTAGEVGKHTWITDFGVMKTPVETLNSLWATWCWVIP